MIKMKKTLSYWILLSAVAIFFQSCSLDTKGFLGDNAYNLSKSIAGKYVSSMTMPDSNAISIVLNGDKSFLEHNYWGNVYGRWAISLSRDLIKEKGLVMWTDSVHSKYYFHNDDSKTIETAMYYYNAERGKRNVVRLRDRDGSYLSIVAAYVYDTNGEKTFEYHMNGRTIDSIEIPPSTKEITILGPYMVNGHCVCKNYCQDSGGVVFVMMPNVDDFCRIRITSHKKIIFETGNGEITLRKRIAKVDDGGTI